MTESDQILALWRTGRDTLDIANTLGLPECSVANSLPKILERGNPQMPAHQKDDWSKPRSQGRHLTEEEIKKIRVAFNTGRHPHDIARELECSSRTTNKYYAIFRGGVKSRVRRPRDIPVMVKRPEPRPEPKPQAPKSRFYTSNFEL